MSEPLRVLIVEDSEDDVLLLLRALRQGGYEPNYKRVEEAETMRAALEEHTWDIILSDYSMPHFNAPAALAVLKETGQDLPFIIISGTIGETVAVTAMKAGAHDFFIKGNLTRLIPAIERELREAKVRRERAQARKVLRERESYFRALIESVSDIILTLDVEGRITYTSPAVVRILGYLPEEISGIMAFALVHQEDAVEGQAIFTHLLQQPGASNATQFRVGHKNGSWRWLEAIGRNLLDEPAVEAVVIVLRDISARKWAETEREQLLTQILDQAREVQFIVDTVPEGILLLNGDRSIQLTNPVAKEYLALLTPSWRDGRLTHLGQRPLEELLTSPPKGLWHELEQDGRFFEIIARPVEDGPDHHGWVFVLRDVTQERQVQQQIQNQERLAAVGQLAAGIAHDFNNSLAVIKLYSDILARDGSLGAKGQEKLDIVSQQTQRAADLIQQILDFSRQSLMERRVMDLLPFLKELTKLLKRTLPEDVQIALSPGKSAEYIIYADLSRVQQAILNLAFNARDAMPQGGYLTFGLELMMVEAGTAVPVAGMSPGKWVMLSVADTGLGMPLDVQAHAFEPFFTTKERGKGTGLGLAQVYGIVQQHDGFIDVVSAVGQGTTFHLYFPAHAEVQVTGPSAMAETMPLGDGQLILVVEDEATIRLALVESLTLLNYRVIEANNGRDALPILEQHGNEIALILSDIIMPEMGGVALFYTLRERDLDIPFVMITGYAVEKDMENLRALGLHGWLAKPLELEKLAQLLHKTLSK